MTRELAGGQRHRRPSAGAPARRALLILALAVPLAWGAAAATAQPPVVVPEPSGSASELELGRELFGGNCARCHGSRGEGIRTPSGATQWTGQGPSLKDVSPSTIDFYLRTGYMPLANPGDQPERRGPQFDPSQMRALQRYVDSISDGTAPVPAPHPDSGSVSDGLELFTEHCAGCHQVVAEGGVVTGARVPPLDGVPFVEIAEAVRTGPFVMPKFSEKDISDSELDSIVAYVRYAQKPDDRGGWGINHLGPFPEGMVTWLLAAIVLVATCILIGERLRS
jgi:ubiquinol-cytochrome c reductase cytochrome c subunit